MADGSTSPVIVGLAIGIGFVVLFASAFKPAIVPSDRELVANYSKLNEVRYFFEKYPSAKVEVSRPVNENYIDVIYSVERQVGQPSNLYSGINTLELHVYTTPNPYIPTTLELVCKVSEGMTIGWTYADGNGIDEAERVCLYGDYPPVSHDFARAPIGTDG
jgi:hypothetical protein